MPKTDNLTAEEAVAHKFYSAFQNMEAETMASCYDSEAHFTDPVFPQLRGNEIGDMWRMLVSQAKNFSLEFKNIRTENGIVRVDWEAKYTFSQTNRLVHNIIQAEMTIKDGKIFLHRDRFDLWCWFRQAMGLKGLFVGWLPFAQKALRETAARNLRLFRIEMKKNSKKKG